MALRPPRLLPHALRLGRLGLERLGETPLGARVREVVESDRPAVVVTRHVVGLVRDRVREELARRMPPLLEPPAPEREARTPWTAPAPLAPTPAHATREAATPPRAAPPAAPVAAARRPRGRDREPIQTRTFARVLVHQGVYDRALEIYAALVAAAPGDEALLAEMRAAEAKAREAAIA